MSSKTVRITVVSTHALGRARAPCLVGQAEVEGAAAEAEGDGEESGGDDHVPRRRRIV